MTGSKWIILAGILICWAKNLSATGNGNGMWVWKCDSSEEACGRVSSGSFNKNEKVYPSLEVCRLICGKFGALWPRPTIKSEISSNLFTFSSSSINFIFPSEQNGVRNFLEKISSLFSETIANGVTCPQLENTVTVTFEVRSDVTDLKWDTFEGYNLTVTTQGNQNSVKITSETIFGARHALETLSQLIDIYKFNNTVKCLVISETVTISDAPIYRHRGLLLDTARNFLSVASIKRQIDGMGFSKLNVLHWHITDSQSFPLDLPSLPNMTIYGAYSPAKIYHPSDVIELISYSKLRGVRIIIEIDAPSHSGNGWQWGPNAGLGNLAVCVNEQPWRSLCIQPPCGQLNPINPNLYQVLATLYSDIAVDMMPGGEVFHMGGDEVYISCWNSTPEIVEYLGNKNRTLNTFLDLWAEYQDRALQAFDSVVGNTNTKIILWTSHLTQIEVIEKYLQKNRYIIQTWVPAADETPKQLLALGYQIIVSTKDAWYLDHGFWGSTLYHNWRTVYNNKIPTHARTLGGEVCMWGEYVDDASVDSRVWPRAAAAAARLWTNPTFNSYQAERRFYRHRERLVSRGVHAEAVIPRWCYQNEGGCN